MQRTTRVDWHDASVLSSPAARSGLHTAAGTVARFVLQLGGTIVVARLLGPSQYGFVVVVAVLAGLAEILRASGLAVLVTRQRSLSAESVATIHRISIGVGAVAAVLVLTASPVIASWTGFAEQWPSVAALGGVFVAAGWAAVPGALFARNARFAPLVVVEVVAVACGVVAAVAVSLSSLGPVALAAQAVVAATVTVVGLRIVAPWRPARPARLASLRSEIGAATNLSLVQVVTFCTRSLDRVLVTACVGPAAGGLYAQASQLLVLPLDQAGGAISRVAVPALSRSADDPVRFRNGYRRVLTLFTVVLWPVFAVLAVVADDLVAVLFGPSWADAASLFRILAVGGAAQAVGSVTSWVFVASGRHRPQVWWTLAIRPAVIAACIVALPWGAAGMAGAVALSAALLVVPGFLIAASGGPLRLRDLAEPLIAPAVVTLVAAGAAASALLVAETLIALAVGSIAGAAVVVLAAVVLPALRREVLTALRPPRCESVPTGSVTAPEEVR
jgi:O-antigen/teichoic acid export membrane protein